MEFIYKMIPPHEEILKVFDAQARNYTTLSTKRKQQTTSHKSYAAMVEEGCVMQRIVLQKVVPLDNVQQPQTVPLTIFTPMFHHKEKVEAFNKFFNSTFTINDFVLSPLHQTPTPSRLTAIS